MPILKPELNKPLTLSLKHKSGKEIQGKYGIQFLFTLDSGDVIYLPPVAAYEIRSLNVGPGEPFTLEKSNGPGNAISWKVERIPQVTPAPKPVQTAREIHPKPAAVPIPPSLTTAESQRIFRQLVATIEAVKAAEEFSISIGRPVKFGAEDIRAMGISGFIEQSRRAA